MESEAEHSFSKPVTEKVETPRPRLVESRVTGKWPNGVAVTRHTYDDHGRIQKTVTTIEPEEGEAHRMDDRLRAYCHATIFHYDHKGRLTQEATEFGYKVQGRLTQKGGKVHPEEDLRQRSWSSDYAYDGDSDKPVMEQHGEDIFENTYDAAGHLIRRVKTGKNGIEEKEEFEYDDQGRVQERRVRNTTTGQIDCYRMRYDKHGRLQCEERAFTSDGKPYGRTDHKYSADGKKHTTTNWWAITSEHPEKIWETTDVLDEQGNPVERTSVSYSNTLVMNPKGDNTPQKNVQIIENRYEKR